MDNREFAKQLEQRTLNFAVGVMRLTRRIPNTAEFKVVRRQLSRSASSIGANYREANRARSKADFRNKIRICEAEASESVYWLEILLALTEREVAQGDLPVQEAREILAIFARIGRSLSQR